MPSVLKLSTTPLEENIEDYRIGLIGTNIRGVGGMTFGVIWVSAHPAKFI